MATPKVVLFDIGGVCVISPMKAIADYEIQHSIPSGYINTAISQSSPNGWWSRLERGEIPLDAAFFKGFKADLTNPTVWKKYLARTLRAGGDGGDAREVPDIDAEALFWNMMGNSRHPDPNIYPALCRLRQIADNATGKDKFVIAACSNTVHFPPNHPFNDRTKTKEGQFKTELESKFDTFVSSAHVGIRKPERRIYEFTLNECERVAREKGVIGRQEKLEGSQVVFLDDIGSNLKGAGVLGIRGIKVIMGKTDEAVKELERVTGLSLREEKARL